MEGAEAGYAVFITRGELGGELELGGGGGGGGGGVEARGLEFEWGLEGQVAQDGGDALIVEQVVGVAEGEGLLVVVGIGLDKCGLGCVMHNVGWVGLVCVCMRQARPCWAWLGCVRTYLP